MEKCLSTAIQKAMRLATRHNTTYFVVWKDGGYEPVIEIELQEVVIFSISPTDNFFSKIKEAEAMIKIYNNLAKQEGYAEDLGAVAC